MLIDSYQFKDRVIRLLFGTSKENALSLYNAVNRSEYDNPDDLEFNTIADAIYMGMKNDFSFLFSSAQAEHMRLPKEEGRAEGIEQGVVDSIKSMMKTLGLSLEAALNALEIPSGKRQTYIDLLNRQGMPNA